VSPNGYTILLKAFDNNDYKKVNPSFRNFKKFLFLRNETLLGKWREDGDSHAKGETYSKDERNA
jgi:hypothetical protein